MQWGDLLDTVCLIFSNCSQKHFEKRKRENEKRLNQASSRLKDLEKKKTSNAKALKTLKQKIDVLSMKVKQPLTLEEILNFVSDLLPDVVVILNIITICPASGAVNELDYE